jgi:hypothetical protein
MFAVGNKKVHVFPAAKRAGDHDVAKHASGLASNMFGGPDLGDGADTYPDSNTRAGLFDAACFFDDLGVFPWRGEASERVRKGVPAVDSFSGGRHAGAVDEEFAHDELYRFVTIAWLNESLARAMGARELAPRELCGTIAGILEGVGMEILFRGSVIFQIGVPEGE